MKNFLYSNVLGYYGGNFLELKPGINTGREYRTPVGMVPGGTPMAYMGDYDVVRGRE